MSKWESVKLGDVCGFINGDRGKNYPSGKDIVAEGVPFINAGHLENNAISFSNMNYIKREKYNQLGSGKIQKGDLLYCLRGSLGKKAIIETLEQGAIASSLVIIRPKSINVRYLSYCIESSNVLEQQRKANNGSSQPNLSAQSVKQYIIPLPPLEVQRKIAETLDAAAALLALRKEQLAEMDNLIKSVFYEMFGDPVANEKGWKKKHLGEVSCVKIGPFGSLLHREDYIKGGIPLINPSHIIDGKICPDVNLTVREEMAQQLSQYRMDSKSVILGRRGEIGRCAVVGEKEEGFLCGTGSLLISSLRDLNPVFLFKLISTTQLKNELENVAQGVTMKNLNSKIVEKFEVPVPPLPLQTQFAAIVTKIEEQKALVQMAIDESQYLFDSLMNEYFN